jgi:hypothetical protein
MHKCLHDAMFFFVLWGFFQSYIWDGEQGKRRKKRVFLLVYYREKKAGPVAFCTPIVVFCEI